MVTEVRSPPYPALEEGNRSWPEGKYEASVDVHSDGFSASISHKVTGVPFLNEMLRQGKAEYACSVSIPITGYRRLYRTDQAMQTVHWDKGFCSEPPMLRPLIIAAKEISHKFSAEDGVASIWQGMEVNIPPGARLAVGKYWGESVTLENLIHIVPVENMPDGCIEVKSKEEGRKYYFQLFLKPGDLQKLLSTPEAGPKEHRQNIIAHVVSRCFAILQNDDELSGPGESEDEKWKEYPNLVGLAELLLENKLPLWNDKDRFAPDRAATILYPHLVPQE